MSWTDAIARTQEDQVKDSDPIVYYPTTCNQVRVGIKGQLAELRKESAFYYIAFVTSNLNAKIKRHLPGQSA